MRRLLALVVCIICMVVLAYGQLPDTLEFRNGTILPVSIMECNTSTEVITYNIEGSKRLASFNGLKRFYFNGRWNIVSANESAIPRKKISNVNRTRRVFSDEWFKSEYQWRVHTNITTLLNSNQSRWFMGFQNAKLLTVEPELIKRNWSLKFVAQVGLNSRNTIGKTYNFYQNSPWESFTWYGYENRDIGEVGHTFPTEEYITQNAPAVMPKYEEGGPYAEPWYFSPNQGHFVQTRYQVGVYPKFYFKKHTIWDVYATAGLAYGIGDWGALTHYETLAFEDVYRENGNWYERNWYVRQRETTVQENSFEYLRLEALVGLEINLSSKWCISSELGVTSKMQNKGPYQDVVYARYGAGEYSEVLRYDYKEWSPRGATIVGNILLGYRIK